MPRTAENPDQLSFDAIFKNADDEAYVTNCTETRRAMVALLCQAGYREDYISLYEGKWKHPVTFERGYVYIPCFHHSVSVVTRGDLRSHLMNKSPLKPLNDRRVPILHRLLDVLEQDNPIAANEDKFLIEVAKLRNNANVLYTEECLVFISDCIIKRGTLIDSLDLTKDKIKETLVEQYGALTYKIEVL